MPVNTNLAFREFGIALFFAAVGLGAGAKFFSTVFSATGLQWLIAGACVTVLPLLLVGIFARAVWKMNFMDLSGLIAGSMTDPPALAFASNIAGSDAPTVATPPSIRSRRSCASSPRKCSRSSFSAERRSCFATIVGLRKG
jgi:putative transport protein